MGEVVDLMQAQGMAAGMIYDYVPDPPWGPPHRCPGCQSRPDEPGQARQWDKWHACEKRLRALGETSGCPIERGEKLPEPYTNEERVAHGGMQTDRLPRFEPQRAQQEPTTTPIAQEPQAVEATLTRPDVAPVKPKRAPTKRAPKTIEPKKNQGNLW